MAKSSTAKLAERLAIVAVVVVLVAWAVLTYLGSDEEAPEAEAPQAEQGQTDADAGSDPATEAVEADEPESDDGQAAEEPASDAAADPEAPEAEAPQAEQGQTDADAGSDPATDAVEADEPESDDRQAAADPEAVPEQPATPEVGEVEDEQQQAPGAGAEPAADAATEPEAPEAEAPQTEQSQTDSDTGSDPVTDAVEADEPESDDGQAAADPEAVPEQPATPEVGEVEDEQQQAPGAGAEPAADAATEPEAPEAEASQAEQGQTDVDTGSDPAADTAEADEPESDDMQAAADPEAVPEQPATPETSQEETEQQQAPGEGAETDADETDRVGVDGEGSIAAGPAAATPEASDQDQAPGDSDGLGTGSSDVAAAPPAQEQTESTDGEEDAATTALLADDANAAAERAAETEELELAMLDDGVGQQAADEPAPDAEPAPAAITVPTFDVVRVDAFGTTVVAGKAAPGDRVDALVNSVVAATETASSRGEFVMLFELDPQSGPLEIALLATGPGGPVRSAETVVVFDPVGAADEAPSAAADPAVLIALEDRVELLQPAIPPENDLAIESISYGEAGDPTVVAGRGAADGQVRILVDGRPVMTEQVSESGAWSADIEVPDAATHSLRVEELDDAGNILASVETPFERTLEDSGGAAAQDEQEGARDGISELSDSASVEIVTVEPGFTLWGISRKYYGKGRLYVRIYHSNLQQIEDPDLIFPGQQFVVPAFETAPARRPD